MLPLDNLSTDLIQILPIVSVIFVCPELWFAFNHHVPLTFFSLEQCLSFLNFSDFDIFKEYIAQLLFECLSI